MPATSASSPIPRFRRRPILAAVLTLLAAIAGLATAESFAERVRAEAPGRFTDRIAFAAFPDDGLTSSALLDALERGMHGSPVPLPIVRTTVADGAVDLATAVPTINDQVESEI